MFRPALFHYSMDATMTKAVCTFTIRRSSVQQGGGFASNPNVTELKGLMINTLSKSEWIIKLKAARCSRKLYSNLAARSVSFAAGGCHFLLRPVPTNCRLASLNGVERSSRHGGGCCGS